MVHLVFIIYFIFSCFFINDLLKYAYGTSFILTPLPVLSVFLFMSGIIFLFIGFISQLIINQSKHNAKQENVISEKIKYLKIIL